MTHISEASTDALQGERTLYRAVSVTEGVRQEVAASRRLLTSSQLSLAAARQELEAIAGLLRQPGMLDRVQASRPSFAGLLWNLSLDPVVSGWLAAAERLSVGEHLERLGQHLRQLEATTMAARLGIQRLEEDPGPAPLGERLIQPPAAGGLPVATVLMQLTLLWAVTQHRWLVSRLTLEQIVRAAA